MELGRAYDKCQHNVAFSRQHISVVHAAIRLGQPDGSNGDVMLQHLADVPQIREVGE